MVSGSLAGRRVMVTGAARGIGRRIAEHLAEHGVELILLDRDGAGLTEVAGRAPTRVVAKVIDLVEVVELRRTALAAIDELGGLDGLVNNAGVFEKVPLDAITVGQWERMVAVNATAPLVLMQAARDALSASGRGRIVNVTSMGAKLAAPLEGHYAASKAALMALTRAAAVEWGPLGVTANAVSPGYVLTDMGADERSEAEVAAWSARSPLGRLAEPQDVAGVVAFLLSDAAAYLTGQVINVAGGMVMF
jgi:NAD(P)-dependent dehydrogenase (short-subunit alcohol dehydrogenase family)